MPHAFLHPHLVDTLAGSNYTHLLLFVLTAHSNWCTRINAHIHDILLIINCIFQITYGSIIATFLCSNSATSLNNYCTVKLGTITRVFSQLWWPQRTLLCRYMTSSSDRLAILSLDLRNRKCTYYITVIQCVHLLFGLYRIKYTSHALVHMSIKIS